MDPMAQRQALDTFIGITGATEAVGMRLLQETGGDLNAAINAFFNDTSLPPLQREEAERIDYMEEDEPVAPQVQEPRTSGLPALWSMPRPAFDPLRSLLGERTAFPPSAAPYDVLHPRDIRNVPVEWLDEEDAPSYPRPTRQSSVSIQDVTQDENVPRGLVSGIVSMEDDSPSFPRVDEQRPTIGFGGYPRRSPERGPFAPQVAEVPAVPSADVYDVEEEMIQAAIEASRRDAEERRAQGGIEDSAGNAGIGQAAMNIEDDDIARAVSLSLQTAEEEKRWRDLASEQTYDDADVPLAEDARRENPVEVRPSATSSRVPPSSAFPDEYEEPDEQPLLRRRSRSAVDPVAVESISTRPQQMSSPPRGEEEHAPSAPQPNGDMFRPDEWGGISSEEQDEAMLLEAALFGGLSGLPIQLQRAVHDFDQAGTASGDVSSSRIPQPLSPSVVEQRLLREQQDDEYLASLAADREKELKAKQEAEAASAKEKLLREEEQRQSQAAAELERKLSAKAEALPAEPTQDDDNAVTILVRLPDGSRKGRRFRKADRLQSLFDFIDVSRSVTPGTYRLVRQYPRRAFSDEEHAASFDSLGLTSKQEALFLEMI